MSNVIFKKAKWSESATGNRPIAVAAVASPGTSLHTAVSSTTTTFDEFWLWASNTDTLTRTLTVELGGTSASDQIKVTIPPGITELVIAGHAIQGAVVVKAFASVTNKVNVFGFINEIIPNP